MGTTGTTPSGTGTITFSEEWYHFYRSLSYSYDDISLLVPRVPHCKPLFYNAYMPKRSGTKTQYMVFMSTKKVTMSTNQKRQPYAVSKQVNHKIP